MDVDKERESKPSSSEDAFYYWETNRLKTFTKWPFDDRSTCNPKRMAEAGFYACGNNNETDLAKCFFCGKELNGWEPDDDPWNEHKKHSKKCCFVAYGRPEDDLTVAEHFELIKKLYISIIEKKVETTLEKCREEMDELLEQLKLNTD